MLPLPSSTMRLSLEQLQRPADDFSGRSKSHSEVLLGDRCAQATARLELDRLRAIEQVAGQSLAQ